MVVECAGKSLPHSIPMRTSRKSLIAGVLLLALQACALLKFGRDSVGPLLSDLAQLGLGILAVITSFQAARRSGTFGRIFWKSVQIWLWNTVRFQLFFQ